MSQLISMEPDQHHCAVRKLLAAAAFAFSFTFLVAAQAEDRLQLQPEQRVVFVGNTFAERMDLYGYLESALYCAYPEHNLTVRNLGWSGDEVDLKPRPANTGSFEENLTWHKADVLFLFFGMNESFAGDEGLGNWQSRLTEFVSGLKKQKFNGKSAPKLVLVSPTAHEDLGAPLPTGAQVNNRNRLLQEYTNIMARVANAQGVLFVDILEATREKMAAAEDEKLSINGIHLNELGYYHASRALAEGLGLIGTSDDKTGDADQAKALRRVIIEKNYLYHLCWRPLNPYYIWGGRAWCWTDANPMDELEQIGAAVRRRDKALWQRKKPPIASVWATQPKGAELWETPVQLEAPDMPKKGDAPQMPTVRRNGALPKQ